MESHWPLPSLEFPHELGLYDIWVKSRISLRFQSLDGELIRPITPKRSEYTFLTKTSKLFFNSGNGCGQKWAWLYF